MKITTIQITAATIAERQALEERLARLGQLERDRQDIRQTARRQLASHWQIPYTAEPPAADRLFGFPILLRDDMPPDTMAIVVI